MQELDLLVLGAGWTASFLIPLARSRHLKFAATTRDGREVAQTKTIAWSFDPDGDATQFDALPLAKNCLITFPLKGHGQSKLLVHGYEKAWSNRLPEGGVHFIQLGSSGIWQISQESCWVSRSSPYNKSDARAIAEDELLSLGGCVLNLAGLWGGPRNPRSWVPRVAQEKDQVKAKKSLHLVHGLDVARSILAVISKWQAAKCQRWMLTDGFVYDWWALFAGWADADGDSEDAEPTDQAKWVRELMFEENVRALPRDMKVLGRCYDTRDFWATFEISPLRARA